jgi:hypothetical protein
MIYYYTCPAKAKLYYDVEGIVNHYDGMLNECKKKYIWIIDGMNFTMNHALQINVAREIVQLIMNKYSDKLQKIIVINSGSFVWMIYNAILPFLNNRMKILIEFNDKYNTTDEIIQYYFHP